MRRTALDFTAVDRPPPRTQPLAARALRAVLHGLAALAVVGCAVVPPPAASSTEFDGAPPPGRVGKIGLLSGAVTLTDLNTREQQPASLNWPLTSGYRLSAGPQARAEVRIGSLAVRIDGDSEVDFVRIDDELIQIAVVSGSVALRPRSRDLLPEIDLITPRERIVLDEVGRYRLDVDRSPGVTALTTQVGAARISTGRSTFAVRSGQRGEVGPGTGGGFVLAQPAADTFDDWVAARDRRDDALASTRYVSPETTGVEVLDHYGTWRTVPDYGAVWYPAAVPVGWAPYRYGRWAYVSPWGWTWIDDAPWGFAPFHYGRWALVGGTWAWVPGTWVARPVYAPALVAWYGAPGVSVTVGIGTVGWFPLGPREAYIPPYYYNRRYIRGVNIGHVGNIDYGRISPPPRYAHQTPRTSTWVPNDAILRQEPIKRVVHTPPDDISRFVGRPTPPPALANVKQRGGNGPGAGPQRDGERGSDAVRAAPRGGIAGAPAGRVQPDPGPPGRKYDVPARPPVVSMPAAPRTEPAPTVGSPPKVAPPAEVVRPQPAPRYQPGPTPKRAVDPDLGPARAPMAPPASPRIDMPRPVPPPARIEPAPKFEHVAPPPRAVAPTPMRGPQAEAPVRVQPQPKVQSDMSRGEPSRGEPPRGGKFQREQ